MDSTCMIPYQDYTTDDETLMSVLIGRRDKVICDVYWDKCDGLEKLAHKLGHVKNYKGNLLDRFIRKGAIFGKIFRTNSENKPGVINALVDILGGKLINWEERNATEKAFKLLKNYNLTQKEQDLVKENLNNALEHYRSANKIIWRKKLINSKIPKWLL